METLLQAEANDFTNIIMTIIPILIVFVIPGIIIWIVFAVKSGSKKKQKNSRPVA